MINNYSACVKEALSSRKNKILEEPQKVEKKNINNNILSLTASHSQKCNITGDTFFGRTVERQGIIQKLQLPASLCNIGTELHQILDKMIINGLIYAAYIHIHGPEEEINTSRNE